MSSKNRCLVLFLCFVFSNGCTKLDSNDDTSPTTPASNAEPSPAVPKAVAAAPEPQPEAIPDVTTEGLDQVFVLKRKIEELDQKFGMYGREKVFILRFSTFPSPEGLRQIYTSLAGRKDSGSAPSFDVFYIACAMDFSIDEMVPKVT